VNHDAHINEDRNRTRRFLFGCKLRTSLLPMFDTRIRHALCGARDRSQPALMTVMAVTCAGGGRVVCWVTLLLVLPTVTDGVIALGDPERAITLPGCPTMTPLSGLRRDAPHRGTLPARSSARSFARISSSVPLS
jgi:hypothetical protein